MPGYELIGKEERDEVLTIFDNSGGVLFRHGFDAQRNGIFKVQNLKGNLFQLLDFQTNTKLLQSHQALLRSGSLWLL